MEGEIGSAEKDLYHVERSMVLRKGATCILSDESGVDGVVGEGERETDAVCEEEEDMIKKERVGGEWGKENSEVN